MNFIKRITDPIQRFFYRHHIENLTMYLVMITCLVSGANLVLNPGIGVFSPKMSIQQDWLQFLFYPFLVHSSFFGSPWIGLLIYMYFFFFLGNLLENDLGIANYNIFMLVAYVTITGLSYASLFFPLAVSSQLIYLTIFLAVAYRYPDYEILLFFILPVKLKYIGFLSLAMLVVQLFFSITNYHSPLPLIGSLLAFSNVFLFYGRDLFRSITKNTRWQMAHSRQKTGSITIHRCHICGITEKDDPRMDFRYCVDCADHEYCMDHLDNHEHIKD